VRRGGHDKIVQRHQKANEKPRRKQTGYQDDFYSDTQKAAGNSPLTTIKSSLTPIILMGSIRCCGYKTFFLCSCAVSRRPLLSAWENPKGENNGD